MSKKYFKISGKEIGRNTYYLTNIYTSIVHNDLLADVFNKYSIPSEYQKVFFEKSISRDRCKEFSTEVSFSYKRRNKNKISCFANMKNPMNEKELYMYIINTNEVDCSRKDIVDFYYSLYEKNLLKNYFSALNEYFSLNLDMDLIFQLSESGESLCMQKKVYNNRENK